MSTLPLDERVFAAVFLSLHCEGWRHDCGTVKTHATMTVVFCLWPCCASNFDLTQLCGEKGEHVRDPPPTGDRGRERECVTKLGLRHFLGKATQKNWTVLMTNSFGVALTVCSSLSVESFRAVVKGRTVSINHFRYAP